MVSLCDIFATKKVCRMSYHDIVPVGAEAQRQQQPVISVDTKKKELIGNYKPV